MDVVLTRASSLQHLACWLPVQVSHKLSFADASIYKLFLAVSLNAVFEHLLFLRGRRHTSSSAALDPKLILHFHSVDI